MCARVHTHMCMSQRRENNCWASVLPFHIWVLGIELRTRSRHLYQLRNLTGPHGIFFKDSFMLYIYVRAPHTCVWYLQKADEGVRLPGTEVTYRQLGVAMCMLRKWIQIFCKSSLAVKPLLFFNLYSLRRDLQTNS